MRFKPKNSHRSSKKSWIVLAFFVLFGWWFGVAVHYLDRQLRPQIMGMAVGVSRQMASQAITDMLYKRLAVNGDFANLIVIDHDPAGHIVSAHFNLSSAFRIESLTTTEVQKELLQLEKKVVYIPALQTMGRTLFATLGPSIPIRIVPLGSVESHVIPEVKSAGINQTVHILYLTIVAQVGVVVPFVTQPVLVKSTIPIAYMVLLGSVPKVIGSGLAAYHDANNSG